MNLRKVLTTYWSVKNQEIISCFCCVLMIAGLLFARAILSVAMIVCFVNALHPEKIGENWRQFKRNWFGILSVAFLLVYILSVFWSDDKGEWLSSVLIKLPFLFLPFAMTDLPLQNKIFVKKIIATILVLLFSGMVYSFCFLALARYRTGVHLPTPVEDDYIRFTITLALSMLFPVYLYRKKEEYMLNKMQLRLLLLWSIVTIIYIHVEAAKTGLLAFYILAGVLLLHSFIRGRNALLKASGILVLIVIGAVALSRLPSVQHEIKAFEFEKKVWETRDSAAFNRSYSFVPRIISYKVAGGLISNQPVLGLGAGDVMAEIDSVYRNAYPMIRKDGRILPHNQLLCTALATGIPSAILLLLLIITPFTVRRYRNIYMTATSIILIFGMMIEPMLEVQFGVFVYLFFTLFWMRMPVQKEEISAVASAR